MEPKIFIIDMNRFPARPDFLSKLPGFFKKLEADAWGLEWSRFYPWTVGPRFGSSYKYPEECVQGLLRRSRDEGIPFVPVIDPGRLGDLVLESRYFEHMSASAEDSLAPRLDTEAVGGRQLLDELLEDLFSLYTEGSPLVLRVPRYEAENGKITEIAGYIEERFDTRVLIARPEADSFVFIEESRRPWLSALYRTPGARSARESSVFAASKEVDTLLETIEATTDAAWRRVRDIRESLIYLQEQSSPTADLREGEACLRELNGALQKIADHFRELEVRTGGVLEETSLRSLEKALVFPLQEERALIETRLTQSAPGRKKKP